MRSVLIRAGADVNVTPPLPEVVNDDQELDEDVFDALVDAEVDDDVVDLVLAALAGQGELDAVLAGGPTPGRPDFRTERVSPQGAYLSRLTVRGFRGIEDRPS